MFVDIYYSKHFPHRLMNVCRLFVECLYLRNGFINVYRHILFQIFCHYVKKQKQIKILINTI